MRATPRHDSALHGVHRAEALAASALYILGDLFEAWIGDDDDDPRLVPVSSALAGLTRSGVPVRRDARQPRLPARARGSAPRPAAGCSATTSGSTARRARAAHARRPAMHRRHALHERFARSSAIPTGSAPSWRSRSPSAGRSRPIAPSQRAEIAAKSDDIMDVNQTTVERVMREYGVSRLLHGHTHRPTIHRSCSTTGPRPDRARCVVRQASVVRWNEPGFRWIRLTSSRRARDRPGAPRGLITLEPLDCEHTVEDRLEMRERARAAAAAAHGRDGRSLPSASSR